MSRGNYIPNLRRRRRPPRDYLGYLEWRALELRRAFDARPSREGFEEWQKWHRVFVREMESRSPEVDVEKNLRDLKAQLVGDPSDIRRAVIDFAAAKCAKSFF